MRAAIYGAGAMGTILGAYITASGLEIDLITRNKEHVHALQKKGAHISGTVNFRTKVNALLPEQMTGEYDVIFLMTKRRDNANTVKFLKPFLAEGGVICTTQNGLPEQSVADIVGEENCLGCAVSWGATFVGKGESMLTSSPDKLTFALGSVFGFNPKAEMVAPYLWCMGKVTLEENFIGARWSKLIINSAFSSLSALTGMTFGEVARRKKSRKVAQAILKEGMDTAKAAGITPAKIQGHNLVRLLGYKGRLKKAISFSLIPRAIKKHSMLVSGMFYDLNKGKKCDIDFISGEVSECAKQHGVAVPFTDKVIELIHEIERGERKISPDNIKCFKEMLK